MLIQPLPAVLQPPRALRVSPAELFSSCVTSAFPDVIWSLLSTWETIPPFLSSPAFSHGKIVSPHTAKIKQSNSLAPSFYFWLGSMTLTPSLGCLPISQGLNFLAKVHGLPMPTSLSSTLQLWGVPLDPSLPVALQITEMLKSSLMDSSKPFLAFMFFHLGLASLPAYQLFLAKLCQCTFWIGHSMCHNKYEV